MVHLTLVREGDERITFEKHELTGISLCGNSPYILEKICIAIDTSSLDKLLSGGEFYLKDTGNVHNRIVHKPIIQYTLHLQSEIESSYTAKSQLAECSYEASYVNDKLVTRHMINYQELFEERYRYEFHFDLKQREAREVWHTPTRYGTVYRCEINIENPQPTGIYRRLIGSRISRCRHENLKSIRRYVTEAEWFEVLSTRDNKILKVIYPKNNIFTSDPVGKVSLRREQSSYGVEFSTNFEGFLHGSFQVFDNNKLKHELIYVNGVKHGKTNFSTYENGKLVYRESTKQVFNTQKARRRHRLQLYASDREITSIVTRVMRSSDENTPLILLTNKMVYSGDELLYSLQTIGGATGNRFTQLFSENQRFPTVQIQQFGSNLFVTDIRDIVKASPFQASHTGESEFFKARILTLFNNSLIREQIDYLTTNLQTFIASKNTYFEKHLITTINLSYASIKICPDTLLIKDINNKIVYFKEKNGSEFANNRTDYKLLFKVVNNDGAYVKELYDLNGNLLFKGNYKPYNIRNGEVYVTGFPTNYFFMGVMKGHKVTFRKYETSHFANGDWEKLASEHEETLDDLQLKFAKMAAYFN